jgi:hypothetical protein
LYNPVSDCGCFGDALKLTNWQTFWKNIILLVPSLIIFLQRKKMQGIFQKMTERLLIFLNFTLACMLSMYCLLHEPVVDFRPYKPGTYIPDKMMIPEGTQHDEYESILVYEKNGVQKEFTEKNFPWQDTTWKWVETRQILVKKGNEPPIHDFSITTSEGYEITSEVLNDTAYTFLIVAPELEHSSLRGIEKLNDLAVRVTGLGMKVYCLTSSTNNQIVGFRRQHQPAFEIYAADETTLKTIMRANPGLLLLQKGTILAKWNFRDAPDAGDIDKNLIGLVLDRQHHDHVISILIMLGLLILLVYSVSLFSVLRGT